MAPRTTFVAPQGPTSNHQQVINKRRNSLITCPICFRKHVRPDTLTTQKVRLTLQEQMMEAVKGGDVTSVRQLVQINRRNILIGDTLLHVAADNNQPHVASFLMQFISPNAVDVDGNTPAHLAAKKGHTHVLKQLLSDPHFDVDKRDISGYTYKQWLCLPLYEAVLKWDKVRLQNLLSAGADPDMKAGGVVGSTLVRELQVKTARQLAFALGRQPIVKMFGSPQTSDKVKLADANITRNLSIALNQLPMGSLRLKMNVSDVMASGPDTYQTNNASPGYVCILNYGTFKDRPDLHLEACGTDAYNLGGVFSKMGYSGHTSFSLTAEQTKQELIKVRDMEEVRQAACLVFVISSYGTSQEQFLTYDMELIQTQWVLDHFKDSQCPQLKDKPKLFIWDLCQGYYRDENIQHRNIINHGRVDEPLRNIVCLHSNSGSFTPYSFTRDGTPFTKALCCTLARHAHHKELHDLYKVFLREYSKTSPGVVPRLTNIGFNKQFYFTPRP